MAIDRAILRPAMYKAIREGTSFNAFYRSARSHGLSMRRADMLSDWGEIRGELAANKINRSLGRGDIPIAAEASGVRYTKPGFFYYRVKINYTEKDVEGRNFQYITAVFDTPHTVQQILEQVSEKFLAGEYESLSKVKDFSFVSAVHAPIP